MTMNNSKALIVTSHVDASEKIEIKDSDFDCVICADGGLMRAVELGVRADVLIGDYDSMKQPENADVIKLPTEKDMTDSEAAIDLAVSRGFADITVIGGLGGRFDHAMGNIGMLAKYCGKLKRLAFVDGQNLVYMLPAGSYSIKALGYHYLSVTAYGGPVTGLTIKGVKYPLCGHLLTDDTTLGISNEIRGDEALVDFTGGRLLVMQTSDN